MVVVLPMVAVSATWPHWPSMVAAALLLQQRRPAAVAACSWGKDQACLMIVRLVLLLLQFLLLQVQLLFLLLLLLQVFLLRLLLLLLQVQLLLLLHLLLLPLLLQVQLLLLPVLAAGWPPRIGTNDPMPCWSTLGADDFGPAPRHCNTATVPQ